MQRLDRRLIWLLTGTALSIATIAHADPADGGGWHQFLHGWGGWFFGPMMMLLFLALLVGAAIVVARLFRTDRPGGNGQTDQALEILRERFAKGEITKGEFDEMRQALE